MSSITYVGLDVHKTTIAVAMLQTGTGEVRVRDGVAYPGCSSTAARKTTTSEPVKVPNMRHALRLPALNK